MDQDNKRKVIQDLLKHGEQVFLPHISVDIAVFGYEKKQLKVLLLQVSDEFWMLPGGYVLREESTYQAAKRNLEERIGLSDIYLKQFYTFSSPNRSFSNEIADLFKQADISIKNDAWIFQRFISVAHYALVHMENCQPTTGLFAKNFAWFDVKALPKLIFDHQDILTKAKKNLEEDAKNYPVPFHLLQTKFTMPELHSVFETIYNKKIDRSRFQKKMFGYHVFERLEDKHETVPHRRPYLYRLKK